ncbi:MAG: TolC family protein [Chiayiivirga sp.]|jgi:cobalt-zinc-cadmium efflux system outer membrane protein|uniref:TolC family protein n=1 Tax=Chiayiivirga sp. TaxID=2041042 RepID=UPI0025BE0B05|nr:TolC family protein [Chiayiivirga sp.]MCI1710963.1 TolC family protein [Chiayiivirga sp.]MCI1728224.1 TolC family protein [Chiayiivirga sp.]
MRFPSFARACGLACTALLLSSAAVRAADPVPSDLALAVRSAWTHHPASEATEQTLRAARARAQSASRPLYNPELEFEVEDEGNDRSATAGVGLTFDVSGKRRARSALGAADLTLAEAEAALRRTQFAQRWLQAWAERLAANERVRLGEQRVVLVQRFADLAQRQLDVGDISTLERDLALLARDEAQAEQATLISEAATADENFFAVGGNSSEASQPAVAPPPWDAAEEGRLSDTPEARVAATSAASSSRRIDVARSDRRPDPTVSVRGGRIDLGPTSDNVLGVSVSVPLFVRNSFAADVVAAQADAEASLAEQRRVELELRARAERTVRTYEAVRTAWERWSQSTGTDVAKRADLLERLWRAGEISTADYLIQLKQSLDTALAGADLHGRLWRSYVDALYATGRLDAWIGFDRSNSEVFP